MSREQYREFLDWFEINKNNLPEGFTDNMSMHEARLLYEKLKHEEYVPFVPEDYK